MVTGSPPRAALRCCFTGDKTGCDIYDSLGNRFSSDGTVSAWDRLVSSHVYADATVYFMFLIQDATDGTNYVDRIMLDNAFFTKSA